MSHKPYKIAVFTTEVEMIDLLKQYAADDDQLEIVIAQYALDDALPLAKKLQNEGVEVMLTRRGTAFILRDEITVPVLAFAENDIGLILKLKEATRLGSRIFKPRYKSQVEGLDEICELLRINVHQAIFHDRRKLEEIITKAKLDGFDVAVGGPKTCAIARKHKMETVEILSSPETVLSTIDDAKSVAKANRIEQEISIRYQTIVNLSSEGIIAYDKNGSITQINSKALELLNVKKEETLGKDISKLTNSNQAMKSISSKKTIRDNIVTINDKSFVFYHSPIVIENETIGAVSTFSYSGDLIKTENKIRKIMSKGLVANYSIDDILHKSNEMKEIIGRARRFAKVNSTILITGETGTGKELFAQTIHTISSRKKKPFVSINCAAIPENLLESELFGYEEGAFTGSRKGGKTGLFELAHTGTIFLDEISAAPESVQTRLLRVLQEREVMRIGSDRLIPIDVRVIAAANKDIAQEAKAGFFRDDLYFRLAVLSINIPPLKNRKGDIPLLLSAFIKKYSQEHGLQTIKIPAKALQELNEYPWPGNIRQLSNFAESLVLLSGGRFKNSTFKELLAELNAYNSEPVVELTGNSYTSGGNRSNNRQHESESDTIEEILIQTRYNRNEAAKILGLSRSTLWRKMKRYGLA